MASAECMSGGTFPSLGSGAARSTLDVLRASRRAPNRTATMMMNQNRILPKVTSSEQDIQHEAGAAVCQENQSEARECPAQGRAPAPATGMAPQQQAAEGEPGEQCENGVVVQRKEHAQHLQGNDNAGEDGEREHAEGDPYQPEQQPLLRQQGGQGIECTPQQPLPELPARGAMQLAVEQGHEQRMQGGDGDQPIGAQGDDEVGTQPVTVAVRDQWALGKQAAQH